MQASAEYSAPSVPQALDSMMKDARGHQEWGSYDVDAAKADAGSDDNDDAEWRAMTFMLQMVGTALVLR